MDTTLRTFYGVGGQTLGKRGHFKEFRPEPACIIQALVIDARGWPIATVMVRGNNTDRTALLQAVARMRKCLGIGQSLGTWLEAKGQAMVPCPSSYRTALYDAMCSETATPVSRRDARRESRRDKMLDVAEALFLEFGYAGTTMSNIVTRLGGSKGTLWSYFPSKSSLFSAVVDRASLAFRQKLSIILNADEDLELTLSGFCREYLRKITLPESLALHRLVTGEAIRFPEIGTIFHDQAIHPTRKLLEDFIDIRMGKGCLRKCDPSVAAQQLLALCMSGCHQQLVFGVIDRARPELVERDIRQGVTCFLDAYCRLAE